MIPEFNHSHVLPPFLGGDPTVAAEGMLLITSIFSRTAEATMPGRVCCKFRWKTMMLQSRNCFTIQIQEKTMRLQLEQQYLRANLAQAQAFLADAKLDDDPIGQHQFAQLVDELSEKLKAMPGAIEQACTSQYEGQRSQSPQQDHDDSLQTDEPARGFSAWNLGVTSD